MTRNTMMAGATVAATVLSAAVSPSLLGQTAPAATPASEPATDEIVVLSPFVVSANDSDSGYSVKDTLAGTRIRTELKDVASSLSVVNKQLMNDIGATDNRSLLQYTANTEVGGSGGNFLGGSYSPSSDNYAGNDNLLRPSTNTRVRGLDSADNTRDYFLSDIPWDSYNVDRVDIQRGPNSILFGVGSPAGIVNSSVNAASFKTGYSIENRIDKWGSLRNSVDLNQVLIGDTLALRIAALDDRKKFEQKPAFEDVKRYYGAITFEPKLLEGSSTSIRVNFEHGEVSANRPRTLTPEDRITQWFDPAALNKATFDPSVDSPISDANNLNPWIKGIAMGRQYWQGAVGYYGSTSGNSYPNYVQGLIQTSDTGYPIKSDGSLETTRGLDGLLWSRMFAVASLKEYNTTRGGQGSGYYGTRSLTDSSIFDFYRNLIDGDNKREWQRWNAGNFSLQQTFFNNRVGYQFVYDVQRYKDGSENLMGGGGGAYAISVDMNEKLINGDPNPNVGKAFVAGATEAGGQDSRINRDGLRFTAFGDIRSTDFLKKSWLTDMLGHHMFNFLLSRDTKVQRNRSYALDWVNDNYITALGENGARGAHVGAYNWVVYLSEDLRTASAAAGLDRIRTKVTSPESAQVKYFNMTWNPASTVDPAAVYNYNDRNGTAQTSTQSENPDNYIGWSTLNTGYRSVSRGDRESLVWGDNRTKSVITSRGATWQGYMFGGNFVPVLGWRKDTVKSMKGEDAQDPLGWVDGEGYTYDAARTMTQSDESLSWGGVLHLPQSIAKKLPGNTRFSVFYNRSQNFKADEPRQDVFGTMINNPNGQTKDYGFAVSTLNDRLNLKVTWYRTKVKDQTLPYGTGFNYLHWAVPSWLIAHAAIYDATLKGDGWGTGWDYADVAGVTQQTLRDAIADMVNLPVTQSFFNSYNGELATIDVAAVKSGNLQNAWDWHSLGADPQPGTASVSRVGTADSTSKGIEFELTAQPVNGWNLTLNVSKTKAQYTAISPTITSYMESMNDFLQGPAGEIRMWGETGTSFRTTWANDVWTAYQTLLAYVGNSAPEIAPWRANVISSYSFSTGMLKGVSVGAGYRWEDKKIMGFRLKDTNGDAIGDTIDSTSPLKGPSEDHIDLWVGYSRRLTEKLDWRIQLNLKNVGESHHLMPATMNPDGTWALCRIADGMTWQLTNTFSF